MTDTRMGLGSFYMGTLPGYSEFNTANYLTCVECGSNMFHDAGQRVCRYCSSVIDDCHSCSDDGHTCHECNEGFYKIGEMCLSCENKYYIGCEKCNANECLRCDEGSNLFLGSCFKKLW